jgi:FdhD protein
VEDKLAREEPLEIRVQGNCIAVTMRTPGEDAELAAGFLLSEGVIRNRDDLLDIAYCQHGSEAAERQNILNVFLAPTVAVDLGKLTRHVYTSSSCGLCGKASIEAVHQSFGRTTSEARVQASLLLDLPNRLRACQQTFTQTGGLHAAGLFTLTGETIAVREDVGRHNAVDKCLGYALLNRKLPLDSAVLLVSGRASFEIVQKALAGGIPIVAAVSAPSSLAVQLAKESEQTLVGFLRGQSMNVYSAPHRIVGNGAHAP